MLTGGLVVVDADALQLQVRVPHIVATGVYSVLITDDLPELQGKRGQQGPWQAWPQSLQQPLGESGEPEALSSVRKA